MRAIKRAIKRYKKDKAVRPKLEALKPELETAFGGSIHLKRGGDRGRDSVFNVIRTSGEIIGVARLTNDARDSKQVAEEQPYRRIASAERIDYEWQCCHAGFEQALTPKPLWRNEHAIVTSFCEGGSYEAHFLKNPKAFWNYIIRASEALKAWHELGRVHMDASLTNVVGDSNMEHAYLIDFEYIPANHINRTQAQAYDYLRLVESSYKFVPKEVIADSKIWHAWLEKNLGAGIDV